MRCALVIVLGALSLGLFAQRLPDQVYMAGIRTPKLFQQNNQQSLPVWVLNSAEQLELHFDDLTGYPRNFYYTLQLCNADWAPADVNIFDQIKGFLQNRLSQYRVSSIAATKYVHYQALLPERNCMPAKAGNYLLKVFLDNDTAKLAFTKRLLVLDQQVLIGASVQQPFNNEYLRTHQKVQFSVNTQKLNILSPQQVKAVVVQNNKWNEAVKDIQPAFIRGNVYDYNGERDCIFFAGKEYRWVDLRSFRFLTDRMESVDRRSAPNDIMVKQDMERNDLRYMYFSDRNGYDEISTTESVNPWWQGDYANVQFSFVPRANRPYAGKDVYLVGELTGNRAGDTSRMVYDTSAGMYRKSLMLKQGYYSYYYATKDARNQYARLDPSVTEGNYWETENEYTILFYNRPFSARHDELVGMVTVNSRAAR
ncbi:type IX secretion system plug protein [Sediminibacterium soli]|uniref:type IX secretion system plug protein n=1 Tax=Sediminibacterium soli TaxID=2698829 RepID=UPI00137AD3B2|nr:DUF5103 domain-containing protein [Sediminibacterium soli]NCI46124.1 DUF5103 domain-containing protein [Sediminibacterium soli]